MRRQIYHYDIIKDTKSKEPEDYLQALCLVSLLVFFLHCVCSVSPDSPYNGTL